MSDARVAQAYATLDRGTRSLAVAAAGTLLATPRSTAAAERIRIRYLGNCLRELDRFLHVLLDEANGGLPTMRLTLGATAAGKLDDCIGFYADRSTDQRRLRALSRTRLCLSHGDGRARRPDRQGGDRMTVGWYAPASTTLLRRYPLGEQLRPSQHDLIDISAFYRQLADRIVTTSSR